ncbi:FAD binding domain-containing protein [Amylocarpus encephaloides]|uniref:FAD binding domain-containing protein n=1 Tax=Amylocarpus encephaloides TaxID=45428 RepID=A0A9P7YIZ1_9HELO|nr:FAD binding domain-containing protein [Amylocarpus encephaloides]
MATTSTTSSDVNPSISNHGSNPAKEPIYTDLLIIGAGPAGASLACFLAQHGLEGIMLASTPGTADTPRAHITNMAALECLRDIGLEEECKQVAVKGDCMQHTRWCRSMTGEEFARIYSWGNDPARAGDYDAASPCRHVDIPQTVLEPILVQHAIRSGFSCRFDTAFLSFERRPDGSVISTVQDNLSKLTYQIRSKYLFGCDGARSQVIRQLEIPLVKKPGQGLAINVLVKVDLGDAVKTRMGNLHWVMRPDEGHDLFGWTAIVRMVKPWNEWMFILFPAPGAGVDFAPSDEEYLKCVKKMVGDDSLPLEILGISKWFINEIVAEYYSDGNIFCLGDAVHRHPPINGLGSNTCIQDAYNLAWKLAYVMNGQADATLLDSYSLERQPVGKSIVTRANQGLRDHGPLWEALGMMDPSVEVRKKHFAELSEATPEGVSRRQKFQTAVQGTSHEFHGVGIEMNQRYTSNAICLDDESPRAQLPTDPVLEHEITTYPGSRLPHAWLNTRLPGKQFSTIDLAGHCCFSLFTGIGGEEWKIAAKSVAGDLGIEIHAYSIGWHQDYEDVYFDWARRREIAEDGCILVRPDRFVAWRSHSMSENPTDKLRHALKTILGKF